MSCNISIFAKRAFFNISPGEEYDKRTKPIRGGHLQRVSSIIRADQIAERIGAKLNPTSGYENDVCIYIKPMVRKGEDFKFEGRRAYIDIIDGHNLGGLVAKYPDVGAIVCSRADLDVMSKVISNQIVVIPQHHCNFERIKKSPGKVKTIGCIGVEKAFSFLPKGLSEELKKRGLDLLTFSRFHSRQDIIDFYMKIDVQIVWRPYRKVLSNPLKIVNAMSFGIPTIALDEPAFREVAGCYDPVHTIEEFLDRLDILRSEHSVYEDFSTMCLGMAEKYHIDTIAGLYKRLCTS